MIKYLLIYLFVFVHQFLYGQECTKYRNIVLENNIIDSTFVFDDTKDDYKDIQHLTYMGFLYDSLEKKEYKILKSLWIWNISSRATGRILIYDSTNKYLGDYYTTDLPCCLKNNKLVFKILNSSKNQMYLSEFSFSKGIPKRLLIQTDDNGYEHVFYSGE